MLGTEAATLGILLAVMGIGMWLLARSLTRLGQTATMQAAPLALPRTDFGRFENRDEGVLVVLSGGRIYYINSLAREWFNLYPEDQPPLELLARRIRPEEEFVRICGAPGRARLNLMRLALEGVSYAIPLGGETAMLVTLRPLQQGEGEEGFGSPAMLQMLVELSQKISAQLDLTKALDNIAEAVNHLVPADVLEITLWDRQREALVPHRYVPEHGALRRQPTDDRYTPEDGLTGYLLRTRQPLLVNDLDKETPVPPVINRRRHPVRAYLGVPLRLGEDILGTVEVASYTPSAYTHTDLETLDLIGREIAVALHNAQTFTETQAQLRELRSLTAIARAVGGQTSPSELVEKILESLRPLLPAQVMGFLFYDPAHHLLAAQAPFIGLPEGVVEVYRARIAADSEAERLLTQEQPLITEEAADDPRWQTLGLAEISRMAGIHASVLYPLASGGRLLGYLQVANKRDGLAFDEDDLHLLEMLSAHIAPLLENVALFREASQRARRAEALRRIASLAASPATLDEVLKFSMQELARLVGAKYGVILLLDEEETQLAIHTASLYGVPPEKVQEVGVLWAQSPEFRFTVTRSGRSYIAADIQTSTRALKVYRPLIEAVPEIRAVIGAPLQAHGQSFGEIWLGHENPDHFDRNDLQLATATAAQMALGIERHRLLTGSDEALRRQVRELSTLSRLSRELTALSSLDQLLAYAHQQIVELTQATCGCTCLISPNSRQGGWEITHRVGDKHPQGIHGVALDAVDKRALKDVADYHSAPYAAPHEGVRSSLAIPLLYREKVIGVIHLHSNTPNHWRGEHRQFARVLAQHIALVVGNAMHTHRLHQQNQLLRREAYILQQLQQFIQTHLPFTEPDAALSAFTHMLQDTLGFDGVLLAGLDEESGLLQPLAHVGFAEVKPLSWDAVNLMMEDAFERGGVFFIPVEKRTTPPANLTLPRIGRGAPARLDEDTWRPEDMLLVRLRSTQGKPLGIIYLDAPRDARRPDDALIEALQLLAAEAGWLLEARRVIADWTETQAQMESRLNEAEEIARQAQRDIPRWLRKDLQQTLDRYTLGRQLEHLRIGLEITTILNRQPSHSAVLSTLGAQLMEQWGFNYVLIAEPTPFAGEGIQEKGSVRLSHTFGSIPATFKLDTFLGQRNPLSESLRQEKVISVADVERSSEWHTSALLKRLNVKSFVAFPIIVETQTGKGISQRVQHIVLATSSTPMLSIAAQGSDIFDLLGRQVGIVLQNLDLLSHTSRRLNEADLLVEFSRQLGVLDPNRILNTLMENALGILPQAHAGYVALWDVHHRRLQPFAAGGYANPDTFLQIALPEESLPAKVMLQGKPQRVGELKFAEAYPLTADDLVRYREATAGRLPISTMIVPLQAGGQPLGVIVLDNFNTNSAFSSENQRLITSLAQQAALALENARLLRTAEQRATQLHALADASADIVARSLSPEEVEASILPQLAEVLPYDGGTLWITEDNKLTVHDARGFTNAEELIGISIASEDSALFKEMLETRQPIVVPDTYADERFPGAEVMENRSWLGVPLLFKEEVLGVIALEKREPFFFGEDWVETVGTFASQAAAALANARLYEESRRRAEELDRRTNRLTLVYEATAALSASLDPAYIEQYLAEQVYTALNGVAVSVVRWEKGQPILSTEMPLNEGDILPRPLPRAPIFTHLAETLGVFRTEHPQDEALLEPLRAFLRARGGTHLAVVPLPAGKEFLGALFIHASHSRPLSSEDIDLVQTLAKQAAVALQNAYLYETTRRFSEEMEARVRESTRELRQEHHRSQTLLRITTELSASLDLDQVLNRTLDLLNEALDAEQSSILLARPGESTLFFRAGRGYTEPPPLGGAPTNISAKDSLAGWIIQNNQPVLVGDIKKDPRWKAQQQDLPSTHRSLIGVPLAIGAETLGALLLFHRETHHFNEYQLDLAAAAAKQIAIAINNSELFHLISEQAESLGKLARDKEAEASRAHAILEAIADGVLVTDKKNIITLFNMAASRMLGLPPEQVKNRPLEQFIGLFGAAGRQWMDTIHAWVSDPQRYYEQQQAGDALQYSEELALDDGRVIAVSLSPVFMRREFLGTVSVFRDITHQVEVDRLKSEFVATVSHELRTPMTSIKGYVDILLMGAAGPLTDQQRKFLETVKNNTERLNTLVTDLLDISRIESGRVALMKEEVDLATLIEEVVAEERRLAEEEGRQITLEMALEDDLPPVYADRERLRQIVENLVENAYRYTPDGGLVTVKARREGEMVQVDVVDTGIGIPEEEQPRVFERFYRGENALVMATAGTGLGLSIVKNLVEMHDGRIWVTSTGIPGEGSTFSFTIPVYPEDTLPAAEE